uniref:Uncharacterized protein n=1 Tax=Astatotilapia calliptera TaxID=8154 RepID=A0A3P8QB02_ASTCA
MTDWWAEMMRVASWHCLERVAGASMGRVQVTQQRMEERQLELESTSKPSRPDVVKLTNEHATQLYRRPACWRKHGRSAGTSRMSGCMWENQNIRVKKVEAPQGDLLAKKQVQVVIFTGV